jgi:hypothetical protein
MRKKKLASGPDGPIVKPGTSTPPTGGQLPPQPTPPLAPAGSCFWPPAGLFVPLPTPAPDKLIVAKLTHKALIMDLMRKFSNQLGFLPGPAVDWYLANGHVGIAQENGDPAGYILGRPAFRYNKLMRPITQAAVYMDAQRMHHGIALVDATCRRALAAGQHAVQASCAIDIEAINFWFAAGFVPIHIHTPDTARGREIVVFRRCLTPIMPEWFYTPPPQSGHKARKTPWTGRTKCNAANHPNAAKPRK